MAKVFDNMLISGLRGKLGKQLVFRVVNGVTIVSHAPEKPDPKKETEAQRKTRTTFRAASHRAKAQVVNPERMRDYMRLAKNWNLTNAYTTAIKDYKRDVQKHYASAETVEHHRQQNAHRGVASIDLVRTAFSPSVAKE